MEPILVGYFPLRIVSRPGFIKNERVTDICSATSCVSDSPTDWVDFWKHNDMWVYNTPDLAWSVVEPSLKDRYDLFAFKVFPERVEVKKPSPFDRSPFVLPSMGVQVMDESFEKLGYDIVMRYAGNRFEHSPLSCNGLADEYDVNSHCLIDDARKAFEIAATFEEKGAEPGPYYVVEVWRQKKS